MRLYDQLFFFCVSPMILQSHPDKVSKIRTRPTGDVWPTKILDVFSPCCQVWSTDKKRSGPPRSLPLVYQEGRLACRSSGSLANLATLATLRWKLADTNIVRPPPLPPPPQPTDSCETGLTQICIFLHCRKLAIVLLPTMGRVCTWSRPTNTCGSCGECTGW